MSDLIIIYNGNCEESRTFLENNPGYESLDWYQGDHRTVDIPDTIHDFPAVFHKLNRYLIIKPTSVNNALLQIQDNYSEETETLVFAKRDSLLRETDKFLAADYPKYKFVDQVIQGNTRTWIRKVRSTDPADLVTDQQILDYRQALRDIVNQAEFPLNITWPERLDI